MFNWGFRATLKVHQADSKEVLLTKKDGSKESYYNFVKNLDVLDTSKKLWLHPLLFNGALQTMYYAGAGQTSFHVFYGREIFNYSDGGICSLDWVIPPEDKEEFKAKYEEAQPTGWPKLHPRTRFLTKEELSVLQKHGQDRNSTKPICVVVHGLGGGSHEALIRNLAENLTTGRNENHWDVVVILSRGCGRTKITSGKSFNLFSTDDIREVLLELKERYPTRPIFAAGFSFGAALLVNFLAKEADHNERLIEAAAIIGCPWDMVDSADHLDSSLSGKYVFSPAVILFMVKVLTNNYTELHEHMPEIFNPETLAKVKDIKTSMDFADFYTCHEAGFKTGHDYYVAGSPIVNMHKVNVPLLALNATDDPTVGIKLPFEKVLENPHISMVESDLGGHLGFVQRDYKFWGVELFEQFFDKYCETFQFN